MNRINKHLQPTPTDPPTPTWCDPEVIDLALEGFRPSLHRMGVAPCIVVGCHITSPGTTAKFAVVHPANFTTEDAIQILADAIETLRNIKPKPV